MKKKLLSTVFALAMGATCAFGFTACGGDDDKDADTASKAINYIKAQYESKAEETPITYSVNGVSPVDGTNHVVTWTVAKGEGCEVNDISDYIKVGAMDEKKQVEISITKAEVAIPYVLTASVTVGKETKSVNFKRKVPAGTSKHAGTEADPYTPSNVRDVAASMNSKWDTTAADQTKAQSFFYPNNTTPTRVYMKGYVVNTGNQLFQDKGTYAQFIYLADTYGTGKKQDDADVVMLMSVSYDTADSLIKSAADINEGDCLTITGFIQNYFKNSKADAQPEISRFKADGSSTYQETKCIAKEAAKDERTDDQKITDALAAVSATMTINKTTALPVSSVEGVSFEWKVESGTAATLSGTNLNVATLPDADATVVLKVTATCGTATAQTKDVTVTVKAATTPVTGGVKFDFSGITDTAGKELTAETALKLFNDACSTESGLTAVTVSKIYPGTGSGGAKPNTAGIVKTGTGSAAGQIVLTFDKAVTKIEIKCHDFYAVSAQYPNNSNKISVNGSADALLPYNATGDGEVMTFELTTASTTVTIDIKNRAYIYDIVVYFAD